MTLTLLKNKKSNSHEDVLIDILSHYQDIKENDDRTVSITNIKTDYFVENDTWKIDFFTSITQYSNLTSKFRYRSISFEHKSHIVNLELKLFMYNKLFNQNLSLSGLFGEQAQYLSNLKDFLNTKYSDSTSLLDIDLNEGKIKWLDWLTEKGYALHKFNKSSNITVFTTRSNFFEVVYKDISRITDTRDEFEKDRWDVRNLAKYGVTFPKTSTQYYIDFGTIDNKSFREACKILFKKRILFLDCLAWKTNHSYMEYIPIFLNYISGIEPKWNDLSDLSRVHIEKFYEHVKLNIINSDSSKITSPISYQRRLITHVKTFLNYLVDTESTIAPSIDIRKLIYNNDLPRQKRVDPSSDIKYIPETVMIQLLSNINDLHPKVIPIVWIMYKTGLRVTDVLELDFKSLTTLNGEYWIETDINKINVSNHRIPIDEELASIIAVMINEAKEQSNEWNNPENLIFGIFEGRRQGLSPTTDWVSDKINELARNKNILDENGKLFRFKNHSFRHTYAVTMLNNGVDIITLQDLLAHASPEMTLRYARVLDNTKREQFNKVLKAGAFQLNENLEVEEFETASIDEDILKSIWTNHKLNAVDTPYGTCMQRAKGRCDYAKQPPCLVCNGGKPCKELFIGAHKTDKDKYKLLLQSTQGLIDIGKKYNRQDLINENENLNNTYKDILDKLDNGDIIYGRLDRAIKKG